MKKFKIFYICFAIFIIIFALISHLEISIGNFKPVNLEVMVLLIFVLYLWTAQVLTNSYISMLAILLIGVTKLDSFSHVISYSFGNTIFVLILSILIIAYAFSKSGLPDRISQVILNRFGDKPWKILISLLFTSYITSAFLTAIAGVSITLPIAIKIIQMNNLKKGDKLAKACVLGVAYGGLIGGVATPLGTPVNLLMIQYLKDLGKYDLTFLHWTLIGFPLSFLILIVCYLLLIKAFKIKQIEIKHAVSIIKPLTGKEKRSLIAFAIIFILFLSSQFLEANVVWLSLNMNIIAVVCGLIVFLPPFEIIEWKDALKNIDWETLIFLVGSVSLGYLLYNTGTAAIIAKTIFDALGNLNLYLYVFIFCAFTIIMHILLSSNTVTGTVIIPIFISFAGQMGVSPWYVAAPACFCISLAFILPTESPTNAISFNTGYYELKDMVRIGSLLTIICIFIISIFLIVFGGLTGLYRV